MDPKLLEQATTLIARFEAYRFHAYPDPATGEAPWTVGYGATGPNIGPNTCWTVPVAMADLRSRVERLYGAIQPTLVTPLNNNQWSAVLSFVYNCGFFGFERSHLRTSINSGHLDSATITQNFTAWDEAAGVVNADLLKRRKLEATLFLS